MIALETPQERKQRLIAAGAAHRVGIVEARRQVRASLQSESLAKKAVGQIALTAVAAIRHRQAGALGGVQALLPLVVSGISLFSRKTAGKPVLRRILIAGALGAIVAMAAKKGFGRWRDSRQEARSRRCA